MAMLAHMAEVTQAIYSVHCCKKNDPEHLQPPVTYITYLTAPSSYAQCFSKTVLVGLPLLV